MDMEMMMKGKPTQIVTSQQDGQDGETIRLNEDMEMMMKGKPIQIVTSQQDGETIRLNEEVIKRLLMKKEIKDRYVTVVSVTGDFRQGKSFLLNFFLRYLTLKYVKKVNVKNWLKSSEGPLKGFSWSPGSKRHTIGIHMWSEIFLANLPTGEKVAIILLDTQGTFDHQSSLSDCAKIFAFSTLISSVQIYNVSRHIKQYDLAHLQGFGGYGKLISNTEAPFQNMCFLVRDWACPYEKKYGRIGGAALLEEVFTGGDEPGNKANVDGVKELYKKIDCFLLPYPGRVVDVSEKFDGNLDDVDHDFKYHVKDFVESIVAPENLVVKKIKGQKITVSDLMVYISEYCKILKNNEMPKMEIVFKATVEAHYKTAYFNSLEMYKKIMDADCKYNPRFYTVKELFNKHARTKLQAVDSFNKIEKFKDIEIEDKYLCELKNNMDEVFKEYKKINDKRLQEREERNRRERQRQSFASGSRGGRSGGDFSTINSAAAIGTAAAVIGTIAAVGFGVTKLFSSRSSQD